MIRYRSCPKCNKRYKLLKHWTVTSYLYKDSFNCVTCYTGLKVSKWSIFIRFVILIGFIVSYMLVYDRVEKYIGRLPFTVVYVTVLCLCVSFLDVYSEDRTKIKKKKRRKK